MLNKSLKRSRKTRSGGRTTAHRLMVIPVVGLVLTFTLITGSPIRAEHALSEVWSEGDGMQMKYLTNHDDLLSTKGSELSLATSQQKDNAEAEPQQASGGSSEAAGDDSNQEASGSAGGQSQTEDGSTPGSGATETDSSAAGGSSEPPAAAPSSSDEDNNSNSEPDEGADSSRQITNLRVPVAASKPHQSTAMLTPKSQQQQQQQRFTSSSMSSLNDEDSAPLAREKAKGKRYPAVALSYKSALEESEDGSETANADHGDESGIPPPAESGPIKFRQPGRLFKQAVKMGSSSSSDERQSVEHGSGGNDNADETDEDGRRQQQQQNSSAASNDDEGEGGENTAAAAAANEGTGSGRESEKFRGRQNMIDFDRLVDANNDKQRSNRPVAAAQGENFDEIPDLVNVDQGNDDEGSAMSRQNEAFKRPLSGGFHQHTRPQSIASDGDDDDNSNNGGELKPMANFRPHRPSYDLAGRSLVSGATAHKERLAPGAASGARALQQSAQNRPPTAYKDLAYFRGVDQQQQQQLQPQIRPANIHSPDNERDNFISPGHFPGSMPHLTQAASETQKEQQAAPENRGAAAAGGGGGEVPTVSATNVEAGQAKPTADLINTASSTTQELSVSAAPTAVSSQPTSDTTITNAEDRSRQLAPNVTPEPESQPESQQIMAPLLMSTTTMAPMPATGSAAPSIGATTNGTQHNNTTTPSSTLSPSLKRFKFRKYR